MLFFGTFQKILFYISLCIFINKLFALLYYPNNDKIPSRCRCSRESFGKDVESSIIKVLRFFVFLFKKFRARIFREIIVMIYIAFMKFNLFKFLFKIFLRYYQKKDNLFV